MRHHTSGSFRLLHSAFRVPHSAFSCLTRAGQGWLLTALVLLAIGLFKDINLLTLLGYLLLAVLAVNAFLAGRGLRRLRGWRRPWAPFFAGAPSPVEVELTWPSGVVGAAGPPPPPSWGPRGLAVRVEAGCPAQPLSWLAFPAPGDSVVLRGRVTLPERGRCAWGPLTATAAGPFGLVSRRVMLGPAEGVVVLPAVGRLDRALLRRHLRSALSPRRSEEVRLRRPGWMHPLAHDEVHGLRPFRPGDCPRAIHWRTSARCGELMVREMEAIPGDDLAVVVDPTGPGGPVFEAALSLAATLCWEWCRRRGDRLALVLPGASSGGRSQESGVSEEKEDAGSPVEGLTGPELGRQALEQLALLQPGPEECDGALSAVGGGRAAPAPLAGALAEQAERALTRKGSAELGKVATVVVVGAKVGPLAAALGRRLRRPVAALTPGQPLPFYSPPEVVRGPWSMVHEEKEDSS